jgi:hypothetical protein
MRPPTGRIGGVTSAKIASACRCPRRGFRVDEIVYADRRAGEEEKEAQISCCNSRPCASTDRSSLHLVMQLWVWSEVLSPDAR